MKEKELRRLKRVELLDMLIEQGRLVDAQREEIEKLKAQIEELNRKLEERTVSLEKAGSIAEASLQIAKVFAAAEDAAKIYLENLRIRSDSDVPAEKVLEDAKNRQDASHKRRGSLSGAATLADIKRPADAGDTDQKESTSIAGSSDTGSGEKA